MLWDNRWAVPSPLVTGTQVIIRSASPMVTLVVGAVLFQESYSLIEALGVVMLTARVAIATYADSVGVGVASSGGDERDVTALLWWGVGVALLFAGTVMTATLTHLQSYGFRKYNPPTREGLLIQYAMCIPFFLPLSPALVEQAGVWSAGEKVGYGSVLIPVAWAYVVLDSITQTVCISGVHACVRSLGSLRSTIVMTIRKFISLVLSIMIFGHEVGYKHAVGAVLVVGGTLLHNIGRQRRAQRPVAERRRKKEE